MAADTNCSQKQLFDWLKANGFSLESTNRSGCRFLRVRDATCLIIDTDICKIDDYPYVAYTTEQNEMVNRHRRVFRFLLDSNIQTQDLLEEIAFFLDGDSDPDSVRRFGANRAELEPDPSLPEAAFEDCFIEAFGTRARMVLHREFAYVDLDGVTRYVDYVIFAAKGKFAIELNGESFHHPRVIGPRRYRSQLFKQNSLVADGFKLFRWSMNGMRDRERFISELRFFLGGSQPFHDKPILKASRQIFTLREHQNQALGQLNQERAQGRRNFLLVLPTGTGKTEIFIEDLARLKQTQPGLTALIVVPTRKLREQTCARLVLRLPPQFQQQVSTDLYGGGEIVVQTTAYMHRHYHELAADFFDYIVVDEAHHAPALGLSNILEHFSPTHLVGVTATPDRTDQQRLEKIFGEYEPQLSLQEAVLQGLVPPVRCYRIKSNVDLSEVRFNGREFVKNDLQRTLLVPSRDQLIADVVKRYFGGEFSAKQGVVFCVDIKHARRMAALFIKEGITAMAVDGRDRKNADRAQHQYDTGNIRFLCACDLLTEGWDAPRTTILVMARPTFSRVLYTQQLGRGLRICQGKEALYVIDVVDNYGARLQPLSLHALLGIPSYQPFADLIDARNGKQEEITVLDGIHEGERRVEPVDIFSFEDIYGAYLNEEQLARELFVSTGTVKQWLRKEKITADVQYPFGRQKLSFFDPGQVTAIRETMGLKEHSAATRLADFREFLEKRDYTFSYKIIFLLAFLKVSNERFEAALPELLEFYISFYKRLLAREGKNEKTNCPYNRPEYIEDENAVQRNLLANPFEKFERKRFFHHCKDLNYIAMAPELVHGLNAMDFENIIKQMGQDLKDYYAKLAIQVSEEDYSFLLSTEIEGKRNAIFHAAPDEKERYVKMLPFYPLDIAAGSFMDSPIPQDPEEWLEVAGVTSRRILSSDMFVARVQGKSMEPVIPDGSCCLFSFEVGGSREGRIVLVQKADIVDQDTGASYTVKRYHSTKKTDPDTGWQHETITLQAVNPDYRDIVIPPDEADDFRVVALFLEVIPLSL